MQLHTRCATELGYISFHYNECTNDFLTWNTFRVSWIGTHYADAHIYKFALGPRINIPEPSTSIFPLAADASTNVHTPPPPVYLRCTDTYKIHHNTHTNVQLLQCQRARAPAGACNPQIMKPALGKQRARALFFMAISSSFALCDIFRGCGGVRHSACTCYVIPPGMSAICWLRRYARLSFCAWWCFATLARSHTEQSTKRCVNGDIMRAWSLCWAQGAWPNKRNLICVRNLARPGQFCGEFGWLH